MFVQVNPSVSGLAGEGAQPQPMPVKGAFKAARKVPAAHPPCTARTCRAVWLRRECGTDAAYPCACRGGRGACP